MTKSTWIAFWILLAAGLAIAAWDIYTIKVKGPDTSISSGVRDLGKQYRIFPYLLGYLGGILAGHLFWT